MRVSREVFYVVADRLHRLARSMKTDQSSMAFARFLVDYFGIDEAKNKAPELGLNPWIDRPSPIPGRHGDASADRVGKLSEAGNHDDAVEAARQLTQQNDSDLAHATLLRALVAAGRVEELAECANEALRQRPGALAHAPDFVAQLEDAGLVVRVVAAMPITCLSAGDRLRHLTALNELGAPIDEILDTHLAHIEEPAENALVHAIGASLLGQLERGLEVATSGPLSWELAMVASRLAHQLGRREARLDYAQSWATMRPDDGRAWSQVGHAALVINKSDVAVDAYRRAFELDKKYADSHLGNLMAASRWEELESTLHHLDRKTARGIASFMQVLSGRKTSKRMAPLDNMPVSNFIFCHLVIEKILHGATAPKPMESDWSAIAQTAMLPAVSQWLASGTKAAPDSMAQLTAAFELGRTADVARAMLALPDDALPFARLSPEEQETIREHLAIVEASAALESLPKTLAASDI